MIRWWNLWWHCIGKRVRWWPHRFSACCQTFASQYFFRTTYRLNPLVYTTKLTSLITFFKRLQRQGDRDAERQREGPHFITWIQERGLAPGTGARATAPAVAALPAPTGGAGCAAPWSREEEPGRYSSPGTHQQKPGAKDEEEQEPKQGKQEQQAENLAGQGGS